MESRIPQKLHQGVPKFFWVNKLLETVINKLIKSKTFGCLPKANELKHQEISQEGDSAELSGV